MPTQVPPHLGFIDLVGCLDEREEKSRGGRGEEEEEERTAFRPLPSRRKIGLIVTKVLSGKSFSRLACRVSSRGLTSVLGGAVGLRGRPEGFGLGFRAGASPPRWVENPSKSQTREEDGLSASAIRGKAWPDREEAAARQGVGRRVSSWDLTWVWSRVSRWGLASAMGGKPQQKSDKRGLSASAIREKAWPDREKAAARQGEVLGAGFHPGISPPCWVSSPWVLSRVSRWGLASALGGKPHQKDPQYAGFLRSRWQTKKMLEMQGFWADLPQKGCETFILEPFFSQFCRNSGAFVARPLQNKGFLAISLKDGYVRGTPSRGIAGSRLSRCWKCRFLARFCPKKAVKPSF